MNRGEGSTFDRSAEREGERAHGASPSRAVGSVSRASASGRNAAHTRAPHWRANRINTRADAYTHGGVETLSDEAVLPPAGDRVTWPPGRVAARSARAVLSRERRTQHQSETSRETGRRSHSLPGSACFLPPSLRLSLSFFFIRPSLSVRSFATRLSLALPFSPFLSRVVPRHDAPCCAVPRRAVLHQLPIDPSIRSHPQNASFAGSSCTSCRVSSRVRVSSPRARSLNTTLAVVCIYSARTRSPRPLRMCMCVCVRVCHCATIPRGVPPISRRKRRGVFVHPTV